MIPFSPPKIYQELIDEVIDTLNSGWITTGPKTKQFERELTAYNNCQSTLCVNSATAGLELMLRWFGVKEGDEVIVPAYTYAATANVVMHCGATPVFVDVGRDFNIDMKAVKEAITAKTKVIMPVDFAGFPVEYQSLNALVRSAEVRSLFTAATANQKELGRIMVLADSAHSIGAVYQGQRTGSVCDAAVFSFHAVKNLSTAEGGAISLNLPDPFNNTDIYSELCIKSLHGQNKDALAKTQKGNWRYDIVEAGYKCNMTDIQASMGMVELRNYDKETLVKRRNIFAIYDALLGGCAWAELPLYEDKERTSSFHLYPLRIKGVSEAQRDTIIKGIFDREVAVNVHFLPVPMTTFYKNLGYVVADYPVCLDSYSREISLPVYYNLSEENVKVVAQAVIDAVEEVLNH